MTLRDWAVVAVVVGLDAVLPGAGTACAVAGWLAAILRVNAK